MGLLERASIAKKTFILKVHVEPGQQNVAQVQLDDKLFCVKTLEWRYSVDPEDKRTLEGGYGWPKQPLAVSIQGCCENETSSPLEFSPPIVKRSQLEVIVANPSAVPVSLNLTVQGFLAIPNNGAELSDSEITGYCMLDDNARGMLALQSASSLALEASKAMPELAAQDELKALTQERNPSELKSLLIGDLVQSKVSVDDLMKLADFLIQQGWSR